jgi:hypothetical protein
MLGGIRANNTSLTWASTSPGEEEPEAVATPPRKAQIPVITKAAGTPLARCVPHDETHPAVGRKVEVVEISSHLPSWLVVGSDVPAL